MNKESSGGVIIGNYTSMTDAEIARGILESAGIECFISNKALSNIYGLTISTNIELVVREEDAKFSEELLNADFAK